MIKKLVKIAKLIIRNGLIVLNDGFICMPIKKNQIIFESFNGKGISDNPLAIYNELIKRAPQLKDSCYFSVKPGQYAKLSQLYPDIKLVKRFGFKWVVLMARANYWVMNSRMPNWWRKNKGTIYIQTWHGTPLKKLGVDIENVEIPGNSTAKYHNEFIQEAKRWNYLIAPNQYSQTIFKRAFQFHNQFLNIGYPRNDMLYQQNNPQAIKQLKQQLLGSSSGRVIMYAPTWRDDYQVNGKYKFKLPFDLGEFFQRVSEDTVLIIRPHYLVKDGIDISGFENRVKILADTDINQLYLITDLLITDYSSVMFDYANLKRPQLFFPYDLEHYRDQLRGFYFQYDQDNLPGPLTTDDNQFLAYLSEFSEKGNFAQFTVNNEAFYKRYCSWESANDSQKVVEVILSGGKEDE